MSFVSSVVLRLGDPNISKHLLREEGEVVVDEVTHHWFAYLRPGAEGVLALVLLVASWFVPVGVAWFLLVVAVALLPASRLLVVGCEDGKVVVCR